MDFHHYVCWRVVPLHGWIQKRLSPGFFSVAKSWHCGVKRWGETPYQRGWYLCAKDFLASFETWPRFKPTGSSLEGRSFLYGAVWLGMYPKMWWQFSLKGNWCNQLMCDSSKNAFRLERNCRMRRHWHWFGNLRAHHSKKELLQREEVYGSWMAGLLFYVEANHLRMICDRIMRLGLRQWMSSDAISWLIAPLCFCQPGYCCSLG